ncbi:Bifunctional purine biosynthesis protein PurH [Coniosporium tulheliwenetii]|uniref:Bifunctional purine biosynthesis protein PurH n=1 Tax=Coniosporium tulheliwenetii TaxID=3383036 RepID=A0ACC2YUD7_9PEZI|nr:Bifunctional purine biosynthesis protein PurH [Cladosporium sp. JES 115]
MGTDSRKQQYQTLVQQAAAPRARPRRPGFGESHTMNPKGWVRDLTGYFLYVLFISTLGPLLFGFHLVDVITCKKYSIHGTAVEDKLPQCIPMNSKQWGLVGSIFTLGGLIGALSIGPLAARYGRLRSMQMTTVFFIIGPLFEAFAPNIGTMAAGRFISGIGAGASVVVVPIYISEVAPPAEKGFFGAFTQVQTNVGILVTQLLGYFLSHGQYWRIILAVAGGIGLLQLAGLFFSVESPKWMADQGKPSAAKKTLRRIRGHQFDIDDEVSGWGIESSEEIEDEEETLLNNEDRMSHHSGSSSKSKMARQDIQGIWQVLRHPETYKAVVAVIMVMLAQQLCGINSIVMYGVSLLADLLESNSALLNLCVSAINIVVTVSCAPLADKLGRKPCLIASIAGMGTSATLLGIGIIRSIPILCAIAVLTFVSSYALGLGPIPFILSSELVGPEAVGATQSWALAANWIATFLVAQFFPILHDLLKGKEFFIFTALAAFFGAFVAWFVPETKGKRTADEVWGRERRED